MKFPDIHEFFLEFSDVQIFNTGKIGFVNQGFCALIFLNHSFGIYQIFKYALSLLNLDLLKKSLAF